MRMRLSGRSLHGQAAWYSTLLQCNLSPVHTRAMRLSLSGVSSRGAGPELLQTDYSLELDMTKIHDLLSAPGSILSNNSNNGPDGPANTRSVAYWDRRSHSPTSLHERWPISVLTCRPIGCRALCMKHLYPRR
jgi:hypothetical protein